MLKKRSQRKKSVYVALFVVLMGMFSCTSHARAEKVPRLLVSTINPKAAEAADLITRLDLDTGATATVPNSFVRHLEEFNTPQAGAVLAEVRRLEKAGVIAYEKSYWWVYKRLRQVWDCTKASLVFIGLAVVLYKLHLPSQFWSPGMLQAFGAFTCPAEPVVEEVVTSIPGWFWSSQTVTSNITGFEYV